MQWTRPDSQGAPGKAAFLNQMQPLSAVCGGPPHSHGCEYPLYAESYCRAPVATQCYLRTGDGHLSLVTSKRTILPPRLSSPPAPVEKSLFTGKRAFLQTSLPRVIYTAALCPPAPASAFCQTLGLTGVPSAQDIEHAQVVASRRGAAHPFSCSLGSPALSPHCPARLPSCPLRQPLRFHHGTWRNLK